MTYTQRFKTGLVLASLTALVAASVAGCGDYDGETAGAGYDAVGQKSESLTYKCGVNKYNGPQGADVSYYQGNFNWSGKGLKFGYARISDGAPNTGFKDPDFDANWKNMKANGILRGAYQFFRPGQNATDQANYMVTKVGGKLGAGDMPCMIDVEATDGKSASTIVSKMKTWMSIVESGTGKKPIIYTGAYFWSGNVGNSGAFSSYPLWIAAYGPSCPSIPTVWSNWTFWQYCDGQTKYCSNGSGFDRDVYNGTLSALQKFAGGSGSVTPYYGATYVNQSWPMASTALNMKPGQTIAASIKFKNTGTANWDSKTRLGTTKPKDRASVFADSSWLNDHRAAGVTGTVAPGGSYTFKFNFHAPLKTGDYYEYFGLVEEGVAWFGDAGQGGPANNVIEAWIHVAGTPVSSGGAGGSGAGGSGAGGSSAGGSSAGGTGGLGAAGSGAFAGAGGAAGSGSNEATHTVGSGNNGGCGCHVGESEPGNSPAMPVLLLLGLGWMIRRRRS